ncbi:MAG: hypothetical protein A4E72_00328 [Syntrophus sp. PtaU1.Bin208]|nr:MAG: hypothetical protein A4E72_00328 [Syntrophus sp. PtaU1.Bin208]
MAGRNDFDALLLRPEIRLHEQFPDGEEMGGDFLLPSGHAHRLFDDSGDGRPIERFQAVFIGFQPDVTAHLPDRLFRAVHGVGEIRPDLEDLAGILIIGI